MEQEFIDFVLENGVREVIEQEAVPGGFRPVVVHYTYSGQVLVETIFYLNSPTSAGWAAERQARSYELQAEEGYQTIEL